MARAIDYSTTVATLEGQGLKSLYHNSGAFGFAKGVGVSYVGWLAREDSTIRGEMRAVARVVDRPLEERFVDVWAEAIAAGAPAWVMPMSHWAYELEFGSQDWMPGVLAELGLDVGGLRGMHTGNAIEFRVGEEGRLRGFLGALLTKLKMSDFMVAFPGRQALCTVHHHHQLWWQTTDDVIRQACASA